MKCGTMGDLAINFTTSKMIVWFLKCYQQYFQVFEIKIVLFNEIYFNSLTLQIYTYIHMCVLISQIIYLELRQFF